VKIEEMKRMTRTFVLIEVAPGKERNVVDKLLEHEQVVEAHVITGKHDILAVLQVEREIAVPDADRVMHVLDKLRRIPGVLDTETILPIFSKTKFEEAHKPIT